MQPTTQEIPNITTNIDVKSTGGALSVEEARKEVLDPVLWQDRDVNMYDNWLTPEERETLVSHINESVNYLNSATLSNGQKIVEYVNVDNSEKDKKLVSLNISIPIDNFKINGVFDISVVEAVLSDIAHNLPSQHKDNLGQDDNSKARIKAEQRLIKQNLNAKLVNVDIQTPTEQNNQDEFVLAKQNKTPKKLTGINRAVQYLVNSARLST